jgi:hypothetical protein
VLERSEWTLNCDEEPIELPTETTLTETSDSAIDITADSPSRYRH